MPSINLRNVVCAVSVVMSLATQGCATFHPSSLLTAVNIVANDSAASECTEPVAAMAAKSPATSLDFSADPFQVESPNVIKEPEWSSTEVVSTNRL